MSFRDFNSTKWKENPIWKEIRKELKNKSLLLFLKLMKIRGLLHHGPYRGLTCSKVYHVPAHANASESKGKGVWETPQCTLAVGNEH